MYFVEAGKKNNPALVRGSPSRLEACHSLHSPLFVADRTLIVSFALGLISAFQVAESARKGAGSTNSMGKSSEIKLADSELFSMLNPADEIFKLDCSVVVIPLEKSKFNSSCRTVGGRLDSILSGVGIGEGEAVVLIGLVACG